MKGELVNMTWKDEIKKDDREIWNKQALRKLHRDILEYVETEMPPSYETLSFNESLSRKLYEILKMIETKIR